MALFMKNLVPYSILDLLKLKNIDRFFYIWRESSCETQNSMFKQIKQIKKNKKKKKTRGPFQAASGPLTLMF